MVRTTTGVAVAGTRDVTHPSLHLREPVPACAYPAPAPLWPSRAGPDEAWKEGQVHPSPNGRAGLTAARPTLQARWGGAARAVEDSNRDSDQWTCRPRRRAFAGA